MSDQSDTPYDEHAEAGLIGVTILSPDVCRQTFLSVRPEDFHVPGAKHIATVLHGMLLAGKPVDPNSVIVEAQTRGLMPGRVRPRDVLECVEKAWQPSTAPLLAERIRELSAARKLSEAAIRLQQRMESAWQNGVEKTDLNAALSTIRRECDEAEKIAADMTASKPTPMGDFLSTTVHHDWLVPDLLERMDRIVLTGAEGGGKSVACSQIACTLAAGLHPFTGNVLGADRTRARVLIVDCENSPSQCIRRYSWVTGMVDKRRRNHGLSPMDWNDTMSIEVRPAGIDLLTSLDTAWLERAITDTAPDLLVLGPLYKLHHENPNDEKPAREIAWVLDGLRERYGFALLTEAHAGKGSAGDGQRNMAPIGSSVWMRWPEFGFGLRRAREDPGHGRAEIVDVVSWRGTREERSWPSKLQHATALPWMPADADYYANQSRKTA
ncbi:AAA family ATPase [Nocardia sp. CA-290969]|uniref:AAA family ATPase n=1 Tax=Nocardia sp. CA-290969 TaxID=3239986 RepID=UPI003D90C2B9